MRCPPPAVSKPAYPDDDVLLAIRPVCKRYNDAHPMTIYRWLRDPKVNFPKPIFIGGGRIRYWRLSDLVRWEDERSAAKAA